MTDLSAVILSNNSEKTILNAIKSVLFCDEIIIIDDNSTDNTIRIIEQLNLAKIKIYSHILNDDFSNQRNFGLQKASGNWILFLDSDEVISQQLANEIVHTIKIPKVNGYYLKRLDIFMDVKLKHGETGDIKLLRLAKKGFGIWEGKVHETWRITGQVGVLQNAILHYHNLTILQFLERLDKYSTLQANSLFEKKVKEPLCCHFVKPIAKFILNYIVRLGFMDGYPGLVMAWLMSWHSLLVRIKLRLLNLK